MVVEATMASSASVVETVREVLATVAVGGAGVARVGCMAAMVVSAMVVAMDQEVLAKAVAVGAGMARVGCLEVRRMAARRLVEGWAVARPKRARMQQRAVRSSRR